jgi:cystathionine gamma-synthase
MDCYLALRGLKTLAIRMRAHCSGARAIAGFLQTHRDVSDVYYPGLSDHAGHAIATRQMADYGGMVSFRVGSAARAMDLVGRTELFFLAESLGGVESLIEVPGPMTHASVAGSPLEVPDDLVRLSVGIEHPDDLIEDLARALDLSGRV